MKRNTIFIIIVTILFFSYTCEIKSLTYGGCQYSEISRLKSFVSNVNLSYDYYVENDIAHFTVTISNLVPEFYFVDSQTGKTYNYQDAINGEIVINGYETSNGNYNFYSAIDECYGIKLGNKYYTFPSYNYYYNNPICIQNRNLSLCKKWVKVRYSYNELKKIIEEYNETNESLEENDEIDIEYKETYIDFLVKIYIKYYYFILIGIIIICVIIMIISRKKNSFDL